MRDNSPIITAKGAIILGVSPDDPDTLARWRAEEELPYNLISDPEKTAISQYGLWGERSWKGKTFMGVIRSHFVIDVDGRFADVQVDISPAESIQRATAFFSSY